MAMSFTGKYKGIKPQGYSDEFNQSRNPSIEVFKREKDNFRRMQSQLESDPEYHNKFVAVHDNEVVGASSDRLNLYLEMSDRFSCGSFYIAKVYPTKKPV